MGQQSFKHKWSLYKPCKASSTTRNLTDGLTVKQLALLPRFEQRRILLDILDI